MDPSGKAPRQPPSEEAKARAQAIIDAALSAAKVEVPPAERETDAPEIGKPKTSLMSWESGLAAFFSPVSVCLCMSLLLLV